MTCPDCGTELRPDEVTDCVYAQNAHCEDCYWLHLDAAFAALDSPDFVPVFA